MPRKYRLDKLDMPELEAMEPIARKAILREGLKVVALYIRAHVPDSGVAHKGKLKKSIRYSVQQGGLLGKVKAVAPHAHLVHEGTKGPRRVTLNKRRSEPARALTIPGVGFRHSANAGPMPANPFLLKAADATRDEMEGVIRKAMADAAAAVAEGAQG
jgi:HK97 gp10 family phage protein